MTSTVKQARSPSASRSPPPPASVSASPRKTTGKRKRAIAQSLNSGSDFELPDILSVLQGVREGSEPQKKKRKVSEEVAEAQPRGSTSASKIASAFKPRHLEKGKQAAESKYIQPEDDEEYPEQEERISAKLTRAVSGKDTSRTKPNAPSARTKAKSTSDAKGATANNAKGKGRAEAGGKGRGKKSALVVLSEDDDDGSGTEVMNQLTQNGQLVESDDDSEPLPPPKESRSKSKARASNVTQLKPPIQSSKAKPVLNGTSTKLSKTKTLDPDDTEFASDLDSLTEKVDPKATPKPNSTRPSRDLTPWTLQRLEEFDESMRRLDEEKTAGSKRPAAAPYGESDVDSAAVDIMYPPPEEAAGTSKQKGKSGALQREPTLPNEVPDILVQPAPSPPPLPFRPIPGTPSRSSLKAKMRPRTPRSGAGSMVSFADIPVSALDMYLPALEPAPTKSVNGKVASKSQAQPKLGPLPQISPSKFYPHLPKPTLVDTTIEDAEPEIEEPMSSIEQFESPEKPARLRVVPALPNGAKGKGKQREQSPVEDDAFWAGDIVLSVEQMRERATEKQAEKRRQEQSVPKRKTLEEVVQQHLAAKAQSDRASTASRSLSKSPTPPPPPPQEVPGDDYDDFYVDEPTEVQDTQIEQEETPPAPPVYLPQEEEESTQDLLHELEVQQAVSQPVASPSPEPEPEPQPELEPESAPEPASLEEPMMEEPVEDAEESFDVCSILRAPGTSAYDILQVSMEPQIGTQGVNLEYPPEDDEPETQPPPPGHPQTVEGTQEIPPTLSTHHDESSQESTKTNASIVRQSFSYFPYRGPDKRLGFY